MKNDATNYTEYAGNWTTPELGNHRTFEYFIYRLEASRQQKLDRLTENYYIHNSFGATWDNDENEEPAPIRKGNENDKTN